jgi:hypothetical protein
MYPVKNIVLKKQNNRAGNRATVPKNRVSGKKVAFNQSV